MNNLTMSQIIPEFSSSSSSSEKVEKKHFDFSIDNILKKDNEKSEIQFNQNKFLIEEFKNRNNSLNFDESERDKLKSQISTEVPNSFSWLTCTRFKPPKLPRNKRKSEGKRQGRGPRIPFSQYQIEVLESTFKITQYLSTDAIQTLAKSLDLSETRVKIWLQNRRARWRKQEKNETTSPGHKNEIYFSKMLNLKDSNNGLRKDFKVMDSFFSFNEGSIKFM